MARPRKPTGLLELNGAFKKNPARGKARKHEPVPSGPLGDPPAYFNDKQRRCWVEIEMQAPAGVLTNADRFIVEITAVLLEKWRRGEANSTEMLEITKLLGRMGLTPADRSKVAVTDPEEKTNPFAEIARDLRAKRPN